MCSAVFRTPFSRCPLDGSKLAELADDPLVGTTLDKRYLIEECIGEGGMGRVYRAKHTRMSRTYAIKVLFGDHAGDSRMRSRFAREAEAVSRLNHANVIAVLDFGETKEGLLFLVMDLAPGPSLAKLVHEQAPFPPARALDILMQLSRGLAHAHGHGLVHRDFKCENVIMVIEEEVEVPKIVDFGICMIIEDSPSQSMLTSNGMIMGTPAVMAPEQASGDKVDHRTDLFSLGIVGYQMLSGCLPFEGTPLDMARKNLYEPIPSIAQRSGVQVAPEIEAIISGLTAKKPDERFQSAKDVLQALRVVVQQYGLAGHRPDDSQEWQLETPIPGYSPLTPPPGYVQPAFSSSTHLMHGTPSNTPMVTEVPSSSVEPKRSALLVLLGATAAIAIGVFAVLQGRDDSSTAATKPEDNPALIAQSESDASAQAAVALDPRTDDPRTHGPIDAGQKPTTNVEPTTTLDDPAPPPEPTENQDTTSGKGKGKGKGKGTKRNDRHKDPVVKEPPPDPKALVQKTLGLYASVGLELSELESSKGKATASDLRADYRNISSSRLIRDASLQPIYMQSLLRLRNQIRSRLNQ